MKPQRTCPDCGATLPADAPRGLCPNCLMGAALPSTSPASHETTGTFELAGPGVLDSIAQSIGTVPRVLLRDTAPGETPGPVVRPDSTDADRSIRYRIDGEIARGGMGAVLKGRDPDLGRDVAIKVLRADLHDKADLVRRFVEEAQIGGQLQHPGVVPIYELGTFADRRPFFSMKLVKGQTLADLLEDRSGPADDLPRFLSIFAAIAQTMAYSHTRGVIHRDLKPSNVMVGSFGEVQVMDWGLARVLPRGGVAADARAGQEPPEETLITTAQSGSDRDHSRAGSIMGTPSYMPPEQARGQTDRGDEQADVFALGSILCEVLTGMPAFTGRAATEIIRKATEGATADAVARLDACGSEAELIALAKDARFDELGPVSLNLLGWPWIRPGTARRPRRCCAQRRHPDDVWVNYNLARVLEAVDRTDEAIRYFTAARAIRPETAHELAHALENRGESDEAIEVFRQLCLIRARNGLHLGCFGRALKARGRSEEAGEILDSAIATTPFAPPPWLARVNRRTSHRRTRPPAAGYATRRATG